MFWGEILLTRLAYKSAQKTYNSHNKHLSFPARFFSIPFQWKQFLKLKQAIVSQGLCLCYIQQIATVFPSLLNFLPADTTSQLPSNARLLSKVLEIAGFALSRPNCTLQTFGDTP